MEQYAHPSHLIDWRVWSDQSNQSKRNQEGTLEIYTDASSKQLGAVITQDDRPIEFFSWKLSIAQHKYSVINIELLAIVKTLKKLKGCYGANL